MDWPLEARAIRDGDSAPLLYRREQLREWIAAAMAGAEAIQRLEEIGDDAKGDHAASPRRSAARSKAEGGEVSESEYVDCVEVFDRTNFTVTLKTCDGVVLRHDQYTAQTFPAVFLGEASNADQITHHTRRHRLELPPAPEEQP